MPTTNYRQTDKTALKSILESIALEGSNLTISNGYTNAGLKDPFVYITSNGNTPNISGGVNIDNRSYFRGYNYLIGVVFRYGSLMQPEPAQEVRIDKLEELVLCKLQAEATRNNGAWNDLVIIGDVEPIFQAEPDLQDATLTLQFTVQCQHLVDYLDID